VAWVLLASMVLTAALTVAYSVRAWLLVFFGAGLPHRELHPVPAVMTVPLVVLAVPTVLGGLVATRAGFLGSGRDVPFEAGTSVLLTVLVLVVALAVVLRWRARGRALWRAVDVPHRPVDEVWDGLVVRPVRRLALLARAGDRDVIETYVEGAAASVRGLGTLLRRTQHGGVQRYLLVVVVGAAAVAVLAGSLR
jgi:NADH-quinone oxidoreductase subunit L